MPSFINRPQKTIARDKMLADLPLATSLVSLPGRELLCIERMLALGVINSATRNVWLERSVSNVLQMRERAIQLGLTATIVPADIRLWKPDPGFQFDMLNLDLEEGFTPNLGLWFESIAASIMSEATLLLTMTEYSRNAEPACFARWFDAQVERDHRLADDIRFIKSRTNHLSPSMVRTVILTACALQATHALTLTSAYSYQDGMPMFWVALRVTRVHEPVDLPSFSSLRKMFLNQHESVTYGRESDVAPSEAPMRRADIYGTQDGVTVAKGNKLERDILIGALADMEREHQAKRQALLARVAEIDSEAPPAAKPPTEPSDYQKRGIKAWETRRRRMAEAG